MPKSSIIPEITLWTSPNIVPDRHCYRIRCFIDHASCVRHAWLRVQPAHVRISMYTLTRRCTHLASSLHGSCCPVATCNPSRLLLLVTRFALLQIGVCFREKNDWFWRNVDDGGTVGWRSTSKKAWKIWENFCWVRNSKKRMENFEKLLARYFLRKFLK